MIELTSNQLAAVESIDQDMLVTAGAGSGKTLVLVKRFVEILKRQPGLGVHNLLAVTYTRKAATEMRTRIKAQLKELYMQTDDRQPATGITEMRKWQQALSDMDSAHIDTIHSLCQSILRSFAVHAGVDAHIELLEDVEKAQIIEDTVTETMRQAIVADSDDYAFVTNFSPDDINDILHMVLQSHLQFGRLAEQVKKLSAEDLQKELDQLLRRVQKQFIVDLSIDEQWTAAGNYVSNTPFPEPGSEVEKIRLAVAACFSDLEKFASNGRMNGASAEELGWQRLIDLSSIDKPGNRGGRSEGVVELRKQINVLIDKARNLVAKLPPNLPDAGEMTTYWQIWQSFLAIAKRALSIYKSKKLQMQKLDYDDLIAKASEILSVKDSPVRLHYNKTFSHILVDEFQDTNPLQAELIKMLAGPDTKLFFIGDDKQSIYKFQGADLATFNALRREMKDDMAFEHSFRSTPAIVEFVNAVFSRLLHADFAHVDYRAKFLPLKTKRDSQAVSNVEVIQLPVLDRNQQLANGLSEPVIEGLAVANWIKTKIDQNALILGKDGQSRPINYGDFAVLVPSNGDFQFLEACLSQYGIPYVTSGGKTFLQRQETYDLENMLLFLSNPSDSHALLGVLRSPMFAISDDLIHQLFVGDKQTLWQSLQSHAEQKKPGFELVNEAVMALKILLKDSCVLSLSHLIYKIIRDTNYDLALLGLPDGKQRYKNVWKLHALSAQKDELSANEFAQYLSSCRQLSVDLSNAPVDSGHSVKLMTIHAAKGLEFPAVALPKLSTQGRHKEGRLLFHHQFGIALNTTRGSLGTQQEKEESKPPAFRMNRVIHKDMDIAEKKRLLYVAMTRARDYLGIFIKESDRKGEHPANWIRPLIDPTNIHEIDLQSLTQSIPVSQPENVVKAGQINFAPTSDLIHDQLLEPVSAHTGLAESPKEVEFIPRITPVSSNSIEPKSNLTGTYFHKLMEYLPQGKTSLPAEEMSVLAAQMTEASAHPQMAQAFVEQGKKLLKIFADSKLQTLMANAKTICHEWSYYMALGQKQDSKRPDLLLETADGVWYVIDYKTDHFAIADIEQQALRHRSQIKLYSEDFETLTQIKPKSAIYFAQYGILQEL